MSADLRSKSLRLLAAQAPVLLQLAQLWAVLGKHGAPEGSFSRNLPQKKNPQTRLVRPRHLVRRATEESVAPEAGDSSDSKQRQGPFAPVFAPS